MVNVVIATLNPAKINAVKDAFREVFPETPFEFKGVSVASEVSDQPMSDAETRLGALNRVKNARLASPGAQYYVGVEAGIEQEMTFAWMIIESKEHRGESRSSSLMLPKEVTARLKADHELGDVMDSLFHENNIKQKGGAIGLFTNQRLTRSSVYSQALILALVPFINQNLHFETKS
ncbi:Non-canonical purine NTP phosphatase [Vibrio aerogenes CECT 7868]|uniref:Inosine/xanthosine triphosphatase n=1 Tax=Vibrio aerogenes CECT 7868 TaxID=1216006 RepID=A0A1M5Y7M1_9VIBR|nr:inosine/xanthosine triphosphatase [Vibrio aerogenes]SHI07808.1 Non-canonical purine NTP phosphatase [Vibrio aerogenes CECT 7868]